MYERHPLGSTCRPLRRDHHDYHGRADHLWLRVGWCWIEVVQERVGFLLPRPLCGDEEQESGDEIRYGPASRRAKGFFEATDMVEGGFEDDQ